jgi:hypothetical protein
MATLGIELCDAGLRAGGRDESASTGGGAADSPRTTEWPGFAYYDGQRFIFGRAAEDQWFVHPRRVAHTFWSRLAHEPSTLGPVGKASSFSELAFHFFREFMLSLGETARQPAQVVLAVPGMYLKDAATEEEKIGLLLGMAGELKLPVAAITDMALAALCDPRSSGFNPALPVVVVDLHLDGAELTLFTTGTQLERKDFLHLPHSGLAQLLKHLTATMGNRFLRHTAFDILEDGRIEQTFFRQTKDFLFKGAVEHRFQINTATRAYEMLAKRDQLAADTSAFVASLVQALQNFVRHSPHASEPCTIALTDRAAHIPNLEARIRNAGFSRLLHLPEGAAGYGAAHLGDIRRGAPPDLADVQVEVAVPIALARCSTAAPWEAQLQKIRSAGPRPAPTHVILEGIGHALGVANRFTIGVATRAVDLVLPDAFNHADDCAIPLVRESGRLWMVDAAVRESGALASRLEIDAGDRLTIRSGNAMVEILFAHCASNGSRDRD